MSDDPKTIVRMDDDGLLHVGADRPGISAVTAPVADPRALIQEIAQAAGIMVSFPAPGDVAGA
jgi:hypothetical protein